MGAGTILHEVIAASKILADDYSITSDIWSLTSINELVRDGQEIDRWNKNESESIFELTIQSGFEVNSTNPRYLLSPPNYTLFTFFTLGQFFIGFCANVQWYVYFHCKHIFINTNTNTNVITIK